MSNYSLPHVGLEEAGVIESRQKDWRIGPVVYHVFVDRFAPSDQLEQKLDCYAAPRTLKKWHEHAVRGSYLEDHQVWSHEVDFWGGDLQSVAGKLDYLCDLGIDCLYLNPIHDSFTNHKYGARDYRKVAPEYGSRDDLKTLTDLLHQRGKRIMLDGVFNHMGMRAPIFQDAVSNPESRYRNWFNFNQDFEHGYCGWYNVPNLPELNLENEEVRKDLWLNSDSVVAEYLTKEGVDGWRLDVAFDIGPQYLRELTDAAHQWKPGCNIVGEVWTDPAGWTDAMDGIMNFNFRRIVIELLAGSLAPTQAAAILQNQTSRCCYEALLRSWLILDNHDTPRIGTVLPDYIQRSFAQILQFCLPGAPCVYYGVEIGMTGGDDPEMRSPMNWDAVRDDHPEGKRLRHLIQLRNQSPALRYGSVRYLASEKCLAFNRYTDRSCDDVLVVANPTNREVIEWVAPENPWVLNFTPYEDQLSSYSTQMFSGLVRVDLPPYGVRVLKPKVSGSSPYSSYKRLF